MGDHLSDPRALRLLSANLGEISSLAGLFRRVAGQAEVAAAGLRGAEQDPTWTGEAADAFRSDLGKLPTHLDDVQASYGEAADALDTYGAHLEPIQAQFQSICGQLTDTRWRLNAALAQLGFAGPHLPRQMHDEVWGLERRSFELLDEFDAIRSVVRSRVFAAVATAPVHHWWQPVPSPAGSPAPVTGDDAVSAPSPAPPMLAAVAATAPSATASATSGGSSGKHAKRGKHTSTRTSARPKAKHAKRGRHRPTRATGGPRKKRARGGTGSGTETFGGGTGSGTQTIGGPPVKRTGGGTGSGTQTFGGGPPVKHTGGGATGSGTQTIGPGSTTSTTTRTTGGTTVTTVSGTTSTATQTIHWTTVTIAGGGKGTSTQTIEWTTF